MNNTVAVCVFISVLLVTVLLSFIVFAVGYFIGYRYEERRFLRNNQPKPDLKATESDEEKKSKREWKNFLKYDGGTVADRKL